MLLPQAQRILHELDMLDLELHNLKSRYQGQVKIAVSQQLAASALPDLLAAFRSRCPDIRVNLLDCDVEQVLRRVQGNEADFGIEPSARTAAIRSRSICLRCRFIWCCRRATLWQDGARCVGTIWRGRR